MSDLESLEPVVNIDAHKFTDTEKELILQVIKRGWRRKDSRKK